MTDEREGLYFALERSLSMTSRIFESKVTLILFFPMKIFRKFGLINVITFMIFITYSTFKINMINRIRRINKLSKINKKEKISTINRISNTLEGRKNNSNHQLGPTLLSINKIS